MSVNTCNHLSISEIKVNRPVKEAYLEGCSPTQCIGCHALWALTIRAECLVVSLPEVLNAILVDIALVLDSLIRSDERRSNDIQRGSTNLVRMRQCLI
jgi:hypothetical protein